MAESFPTSGNIDPKSFPFLLMDLHRQGATGSLKVEGPSYPKALYYRSGRILFGSSNDPKDQLGSILIENGKITAEQLADVNTKVGPGNPLAKVLAESGFVSQRELGEAARIKVERILSDIIGYTSGNFEFEDGVLPKGAVDLKLATEKLVLAAVRRIADRSFVLRHLGGLDVVLALRPGVELPDVRHETSGLPSHLNGQLSLKEAARAARIDEFDAAKIACGLLFLGLVERSTAGVDAALSADPELDLAATAAMAFGGSEPGGPPPGASVEEDDPFFTAVGESPALDATESAPFPLPEPPPAFPMPDEEPFAPPDASVLDEPPAFLAPEPEAEPEPHTLPRMPAFVSPDEPEEPAPAPRSRPSEPTGFAMGPELETTALPVIPPPPPPRDDAPPNFSMPPFAAEPMPADGEGRHDPVTPSRPSKEDLAALDALLNPATSPRPLEPAKAPSRSGHWEPQFQSMARPRRPTRAQTSPVLLISLGAGVIALIAGGSWWYLNQVQSTPVAQAPVPVPRPTPVAAPPAPSPSTLPGASPDASSPSPSGVPSAAATAAAPLPATPSPRPTPTPKPVAAAAVSPLDDGPVTEARSLMRKGSFGPAAKGFAANVKAAANLPFTVQLLVACSTETVQKALERVSDDDLYILPVNYKGRSCHRICWGLYHDEAGANSAIPGLPEYFRQNGANPKVVKTTTLAR
jgi:Domain of unknown function (DUF4388)